MLITRVRRSRNERYLAQLTVETVGAGPIVCASRMAGLPRGN